MATSNFSGFLEVNNEKRFDSSYDLNIDTSFYEKILNASHELHNDMSTLY